MVAGGTHGAASECCDPRGGQSARTKGVISKDPLVKYVQLVQLLTQPLTTKGASISLGSAGSPPRAAGPQARSQPEAGRELAFPFHSSQKRHFQEVETPELQDLMALKKQLILVTVGKSPFLCLLLVGARGI